MIEKEQRNNTYEREKRKDWRLSIVSTLVLIVFMLAYLVMTIDSSNKLSGKTEIISEHPFEVVISAGDLKTQVTEMRIRMERLTSHREEKDLQMIRETIPKLFERADKALREMEAQYLGDPKDIEQLEETMTALRNEQKACLEFAALDSSTTEGIERYQGAHLYSLYELADKRISHIISVAKDKKVQYGEEAGSLRAQTLLGSIILIFLMVGVLLFTQYIMYRQRRELARRSALFDNLSTIIDDTFIICDAETKEMNYVALNIERVLGRKVETMEDAYQGMKQGDVQAIRKTVSKPDFKSPYIKTLEFTRPDGEKRWITVSVYRAEDLKRPSLICFFSDCTAEVKSKQVLQDALLGAEKANMAKSDFLSRMSHEIRTPLNAVIGMSAIAAASIDDPARVADCLTKINFSSKHLLLLINDILDMSKIESKKMMLHNETFDLFEAVNTFVSTVYPQAKAKGIDFSETMEDFGEQMQYIGDPLRLNQILLNLSSNAVKFTAKGGKITLRVSRIVTRGNTDVIRFVLSDTGIGMTEEEIERIFKPFEQANSSISGRFGGTGLGMSITKNLVELMDGKIMIESEAGVGTSCIVELPFQHSVETEEEPDFADQGLHALIVDDEQEVCEQTTALLNKIKIQAEWVLTGEEAVRDVTLAHRNGEDYDFCLIDWKIPDMDGIEITKCIRNNVGWGLPIVMISAYDYSEIEEEAREAGVNAFLPKPLYKSSVLATIKTALKKDTGKRVAATEEASLEGRRVLVAEDNALNQEVLTTLLQMKGVETSCAENGKQALDLFRASEPGHFDAILMDVQMPVMDGHEAAKAIRNSEHDDAQTVPIIAITANAFSDDISAALSAGMNAHVSKPVDIDVLSRLLSDLLIEKEENAVQAPPNVD